MAQFSTRLFYLSLSISVQFVIHLNITPIHSRNKIHSLKFELFTITVLTILCRAVVSYPGSGNTWLRDIIEAATGLVTGYEVDVEKR